MASKQQSLGDAKSAKLDEFYTQLSDIEKELRHYKAHFKDKVVYLKCDDHRESEQQGICPSCKQHFELAQMQADSKMPWSKGGKTIAGNWVLLCAPCNRKKWDV